VIHPSQQEVVMRSLAVVPLVALAALCSACGGGGDGGQGPASPSTQSGLLGTWMATRAEYVSRANPSLRVEVISQGTTMVLALESGSYTLTITDPGESPTRTTGSWSASIDVLTLTPAGMSYSIQFDMNLSGSTLTLTGGDVEYDIDGDDVNEQTKLSATLVR
jgi:hypothetical protein